MHQDSQENKCKRNKKRTKIKKEEKVAKKMTRKEVRMPRSNK